MDEWMKGARKTGIVSPKTLHRVKIDMFLNEEEKSPLYYSYIDKVQSFQKQQRDLNGTRLHPPPHKKEKIMLSYANHYR